MIGPVWSSWAQRLVRPSFWCLNLSSSRYMRSDRALYAILRESKRFNATVRDSMRLVPLFSFQLDQFDSAFPLDRAFFF
ncbi:TPA: hypothetical protein ACM49A_004679, partial [Escherichia coli]